MNHPFRALFCKHERRLLGLMSGTSLDGIDVADVRIVGSGKDLTWQLEGFVSAPISEDVREVILRNSVDETSSVSEIALLSDLLALEYQVAIEHAVESWNVSLVEYDAVGLHGQTLFHQPESVKLAGRAVRATLQIGDPSMLANRLELPVVGDFRVADMALGGQGAPLVPYFDLVTFGNAEEGRLLINLGGIANLTVLAKEAGLEDVRAFDSGPGNMISDALARTLLGTACDEDGRTASSGTVHRLLLDELLADPFFQIEPPRSTGRELFSEQYVSRLTTRGDALGLSQADLFATVAALTADSIVTSWEAFIRPAVQIDRVLVSGGGVYNQAIMNRLRDGFDPLPLDTTSQFGVDPEAKEAICFAVLAHETLNGVSTSITGATGASQSTILGKICLPRLTEKFYPEKR